MGKFNSNDMDNIGDIPFYSCKSDNPCGYHSVYSFDYIGYLLLVCAGGSQNNIIGDNVGLGKCYYVNGKTACRANVCSLISKIKEINIKYIYYYLNINRLETNKKAHFTTNLGTISLNEISNLKIPIPSIEIQNKIVEYLDMIYETVIKNNNEKIENIKKLNKNYLELNLQFNKEIEIKTLGEIASINQGKLLIKNDMIDGLYDVIGGGKIIGTHNINNRDGDDVIITRVGDININYISNAYYLTDNAFSLKTLNNNIMITKYLYYIILNNKQYLKDLYIGTAQKVISKTNLSNVKIPIPSIEKQKEIIEYLEFNDNLIKTLEKENEINKNNAELLMKQILYK
jgi:type I restriction enzyme S subunit